MHSQKTPVDIYKILPRTNCRQCGIATCMAFAAAIVKQEKSLSDCPHLAPDVMSELSGKVARQVNLETIQDDSLKELRRKVSGIDLLSRVEELGARRNGEAIVITCLGRDFEVDRQGTVKSHCHTHAWFSIPLLDYIVSSMGRPPSGIWLPFRELENGRTWSPLFERRCEQPLKQIADSHPDLFEDLVTMFSGRVSPGTFKSDISVVLHPLPRVPMLISYWNQEEDMDSKLHLFFDETAETHLHIDSLFTLATGIVRMIEKIMLTHTGAPGILL